MLLEPELDYHFCRAYHINWNVSLCQRANFFLNKAFSTHTHTHHIGTAFPETV